MINKKAENFTNTFLTRRINPEDIYNACERRNISASDLERIIDNIEETLKNNGITVYPYTQKLKEKAKTSSEYEKYKKIRTSHYSALHDAMTILYVKDKRTKRIRQFENVNCWLVNNSTSHETEEYRETSSEYQKEAIRVDELLNILWLTNPSINTSLDNEDLIEIGLSSIVAYTLNESLPKASIIRELDENIQKYRSDIISDRDIINISSRISNKQLKNINDLNILAQNNTEEFVKKLKNEALLQEKEENERILKFEELYQKFELQINTLDKANINIKSKANSLQQKEEEFLKIKEQTENEKLTIQKEVDSLKENIEFEKQQNLLLLKQINDEKIQNFISNKIKEWRQSSWNQLFICITIILSAIIYIFYLSDFNLKKTELIINQYSNNVFITAVATLITFIFTFFILKNLRDKYHNHSNIKSFKEMLKIPNDL